MRDATDFAAKLGLALKALNFSRGRLASEARVDKSLVSRWLRGVSAPRGHNLEAVTSVIGASVPGFSQLSWELPMEAFARLFGAVPQGDVAAADVAPAGWITETDRQVAEQRGGAYEGFWRATHPSLTGSGVLFHRYARIRREPDGILHVSFVSGLMSFSGPLFVVLDQLYAITRDETDGTFAFLVFHGVIPPVADALDGLALSAAKTQQRPLCACPYFLERIGDLSGDRDADDAMLESLRQRPTDAVDVADDLRRHLLRDTGPVATLDEAVMRLATDSSRSRGRSRVTGA